MGCRTHPGTASRLNKAGSAGCRTGPAGAVVRPGPTAAANHLSGPGPAAGAAATHQTRWPLDQAGKVVANRQTRWHPDQAGEVAANHQHCSAAAAVRPDRARRVAASRPSCRSRPTPGPGLTQRAAANHRGRRSCPKTSPGRTVRGAASHPTRRKNRAGWEAAADFRSRQDSLSVISRSVGTDSNRDCWEVAGEFWPGAAAPDRPWHPHPPDRHMGW